MLCDPKSYAFYNLAYFKYFSLAYPWYEIEPLEQPTLGENKKK